MRKIVVFILFLVFGISKAQESLPVNECRIGALKGITIATVSLSYERIIKQDMGLGATIDFNFSNSNYPQFVFTPYYRFYFLDTKVLGVKGLFVETFASVVNDNKEEEEYGDVHSAYVYPERNYTDLALGFSVGKKWVHKHNFVFEINAGIGRFLGLDKHNPEVYFPRFGMSLGYRF